MLTIGIDDCSSDGARGQSQVADSDPWQDIYLPVLKRDLLGKGLGVNHFDLQDNDQVGAFQNRSEPSAALFPGSDMI